MKKRFILMTLVLAVWLGGSPAARAAGGYITDPGELRGGDFTDDAELARGLDRIFAGAPMLFGDLACTARVPAEMGSRAVPVGRTLYVRDLAGRVYSGSSCYIYANAVYATLFGDVPFHGDEEYYVNSVTVIRNGERASYAMFCGAGVRCGALMRTTGNRDGSYNGNSGHSVIILSYDRQGLTYLEGNGDGRGLIRVAAKSWDDFNRSALTGKGRRICFVTQPKGPGGAAGGDLVGYFRKNGGVDFSDVAGGAWYAPGVELAYSLGLMNGRGGAMFAPDEPVTAAEAVTVAARFLAKYYGDMYDFSSNGPWYAPYYEYLGLWGIGLPSPAPDGAMTRGGFAALCAGALPEADRVPVRDVSFADVPAGSVYGKAVGALAGAGIVNGSGGLFRPEGTLTRAEAAVILARMADRSMRAAN